MRKYIGTYRVYNERDLNGEVTDLDFTYIKGTGATYKNTTISRFDDDNLKVIHHGKISTILNNFEKYGIECIDIVDCEGECAIVFNEKHLSDINKFMNIASSGSKTPPESIKNHPRYKEIKQERFDALSEDEKQKRIERGERLRKYLSK